MLSSLVYYVHNQADNNQSYGKQTANFIPFSQPNVCNKNNKYDLHVFKWCYAIGLFQLQAFRHKNLTGESEYTQT